MEFLSRPYVQQQIKKTAGDLRFIIGVIFKKRDKK